MNTTSENTSVHNLLAIMLVMLLLLVCSCSNQQSTEYVSLSDTLENIIIKELITTQAPSGKKVDVYIKIDTAQYQHTLYVNDHPLKFLNTGFEGYEDDPLDESDVFRMGYFQSPDYRWLYVILKPSIAGSCDIFYKVHVYRIDMESYKVDFLFNCGAFQLYKDGFMAAHQVECVNEDEYTCCADMRFTAQLVYYDFNGKEIKRGKVMDGDEIFGKFSSNSFSDDNFHIELKENYNSI